jgi:hypothetical protein
MQVVVQTSGNRSPEFGVYIKSNKIETPAESRRSGKGVYKKTEALVHSVLKDFSYNTRKREIETVNHVNRNCDCTVHCTG